mgnify:CR=1 FL=1
MRKDWDIIRNDYIRYPITHKELSKKYKVTTTSIAYHSIAENWVKLRDEYLSKSALKTQELLINDTANDNNNERKERIRKFKSILHKGLNTLSTDDKIKIKSR